MEPEAYAELNLLEADHWWYVGMRGITEQLLRKYIYSGSNLRILDAGCGTGGNLTALSQFGDLTGVDYSSLALSYAANSHLGKITRGSVEQLPYPSGAFDLVTSFDVIYAWEVKDDQQAINEFARVIRPGGGILLRLPALPILRGPHDQMVHGRRRYVATHLRDMLAKAGLQVDRMTYANALLLPFIYVVRRLQTLLTRAGMPLTSDVKPTPAPANSFLKALLGVEARWIAAGGNFSAGVSLFAVATKPTAPDHSFSE